MLCSIEVSVFRKSWSSDKLLMKNYIKLSINKASE